MNDCVRKALLPQPRECLGSGMSGGVSDISALDAKKGPGTFLKSGRRPAEETREVMLERLTARRT